MSKKLSQLTEKVTSLSADDLLYVSSNGVSKSIKASTVEAPLKAYADQKKSEVITEIEALEDSLNTETSNRVAAISSEQSTRIAADSSLQAAINAEITRAQAAESSLSDSISSEASTRQAADSVVLQDAKNYTDQKVSDLIAAAPEVLNTINELAQAINNDQSFATTIATQISQLASNLSSEITRAQSAESSLSTALESSTPIGTIQMYVGPILTQHTPTGEVGIAPNGWLLCNGAVLRRDQYAALFSVIGTTFGSGNGVNSFNLPDPDGNENINFIIKA